MDPLERNIILTLKSGPMSANGIARRLGVDPTTVSRRLNSMQGSVIREGAGRSVRWHLIRTLPQLTHTSMLPIYRVNSDGTTDKIAHLYVVHPENAYLVEYFRPENNGKPEWDYYESLPWWLSDMRPQGFLGRSFAHELRRAGENVDTDPAKWSEDQVLSILANHPQNHVGNLLVGSNAYERWLESETLPIRSDEYAGAMAEAIARGEHFDSSAQGEQPKFAVRLAERECLVKFSGQVTQLSVDSVPSRWADLLLTESIAAQALNMVIPGLAAANRTFKVNQRTLLASQRFDRTLEGGRIGVISFASLDGEFVGQANQPWPVIADALYQQRVITEIALTHSKIAWAFGQLIANSDMHLGNLSVVNRGGRPYELAPIYDMLPMHYSPKTTGDLPSDPFHIRADPAVPRVYWELAYPAALQFWDLALEHSSISKHFKELAKQQHQVVKEFGATIRRMV